MLGRIDYVVKESKPSEESFMKEFIEYVVKNLVDKPELVEVTQTDSVNFILVELKCDKPDIGKVIGKKGATINAIRHLMISIASRNHLRVNLEIIE